MRATSPTGRPIVRCQRGFTLMELLVVIAIMLALAGLFPVALDRMIPARRAVIAAQRTVQKIHELQSEAARSDRVISIAIQPHSLRIDGAADGNSELLQFPSSVEVALRSDAQRHELVLYPDGSTTGGLISFIDGKHRTNVAVSALTGRVRVRT